MGNTFGNMPNYGINLYRKPDEVPHPLKEPTFDPLMGFPDGRVERKMEATIQELESAKVPLKDRDYCSHLLLKFRSCRKDNWPWAVKCTHEKHAYLNCQYDDWILRMKEFERERRLMLREKRRRKAAEVAAA